MPNDRPAALPVYRFGGFTLDNHKGVLLSPDGQEIAFGRRRCNCCACSLRAPVRCSIATALCGRSGRR